LFGISAGEGNPDLQAGLHAIGNIERAIYTDAYPDGLSIRFEYFSIWAE